MASEWFNTAHMAVRSGHRPLYDVVRRPQWHNLTAEGALAVLLDKRFSVPLRYHINDAYMASEDFLNLLDETNADLGPWVSFRHNESVYMVFSSASDAAVFRLMWSAY